jgi:hypothetical protein
VSTIAGREILYCGVVKCEGNDDVYVGFLEMVYVSVGGLFVFLKLLTYLNSGLVWFHLRVALLLVASKSTDRL